MYPCALVLPLPGRLAPNRSSPKDTLRDRETGSSAFAAAASHFGSTFRPPAIVVLRLGLKWSTQSEILTLLPNANPHLRKFGGDYLKLASIGCTQTFFA